MNTQRMIISFGILILAIAAFSLSPLLAQEEGGGNTYPLNTITVTGNGTAYGSPDVANLGIGVEIINADLAAAFSEVNSQIDTIVAALLEAGVAREDIRTVGLNVYIDRSMGMGGPAVSGPEGAANQNYVVSNQLQIVVRDINAVADVIDAAVAAGANNIFGLNFGIDDATALEGEARVDAVADARARAEQLAEITGVTLGDVLIINEGYGSPVPMYGVAMERAMGGGGGASVEPGQLSVNMQVTVTYAISR